MSVRKRKIVTACILIAVLCLFGASLILLKLWNINRYFASGYELCGVDVSHYQGEIDWKRIAEQDVDFAFIKATEGSSHLDQKFAENWKRAEASGLHAGAYHFFSFDSEGEKQAEWFIKNVGSLEGKLAPVVDVEFYGDKEVHRPEKEQVVRELTAFLTALEEKYQVKPVIYTTYKVYRLYIDGEFEEYPLWIRNVYYPPDLDMKGRWEFWQYTDRAVLSGYHGEEKYIDLNVFKGTREELEGYLVGPLD